MLPYHRKDHQKVLFGTIPYLHHLAVVLNQSHPVTLAFHQSHVSCQTVSLLSFSCQNICDPPQPLHHLSHRCLNQAIWSEITVSWRHPRPQAQLLINIAVPGENALTPLGHIQHCSTSCKCQIKCIISHNTFVSLDRCNNIVAASWFMLLVIFYSGQSTDNIKCKRDLKLCCVISQRYNTITKCTSCLMRLKPRVRNITIA